MKRTWTIIGVRDVPFSFKWYQSLFGQPETAPGHEYWGQICDSDGTVLLCLHEWGSHDHPSLASPDEAPPLTAKCEITLATDNPAQSTISEIEAMIMLPTPTAVKIPGRET